MIEKGIDIPDSGSRRRYEFNMMDVGDSIFFEGEKYVSKPMNAARSYGERNGKKFIGRQFPAGLRIWRVE